MRKTVKGMRRWTKRRPLKRPLSKEKSKERRHTKPARHILKSWARTDNSFAEGIPLRHASRASKPYPQVYPQRRIRVPSSLKRIFHDTYTLPPAKCQSTNQREGRKGSATISLSGRPSAMRTDAVAASPRSRRTPERRPSRPFRPAAPGPHGPASADRKRGPARL